MKQEDQWRNWRLWACPFLRKKPLSRKRWALFGNHHVSASFIPSVNRMQVPELVSMSTQNPQSCEAAIAMVLAYSDTYVVWFEG